MSLRTKTLVLITIVFVALLTLQTFGVGFILQDTYLRLERKDARRNLVRIQNVFDDAINQMSTATKGIAQKREWADFLENPASNKQPETGAPLFTTNRWNLFVVADLDGRIWLSQSFDLDQQILVDAPPPSAIQDAFNRSEFHGIVMAEEGPTILTSHQIPGRGYLVTGRILTAAEIAFLGSKLHLDTEFNQIFRTNAEREAQNRLVSEFEAGQARLVPRDDQLADLLVTFKDAQKRPAFELKVILKRDFYLQAQESFHYLLATVAGVGLVFAMVMLVVLERLVLHRVGTLSRDVRVISSTKDTKARVHDLGDDELGRLANDFNELLHAEEQLVAQVHEEQAKADKLLHNILPAPIVEKLKNNASGGVAEKFEEATILFADIVNFTPLAKNTAPEELVETLNTVFSAFDRLAEKYGLEKIKTIGDAYMVAGGIPDRKAGHAEAIADMALDMLIETKILSKGRARALQIRIGIHTGPVVAGVIGTKKFLYDLWGDTVNIASRMESSALEDTIQVSSETQKLLGDRFLLESRGEINIKGRGLMNTWFLQGRSRRAVKPEEAA